MSKPTLAPDLVERVLGKLGLHGLPSVDLAGLNTVYRAFSSSVSNDNVQKRIWLTGDRASPVTGGDPAEFFENWLTHGTGGTCFPINGSFAALLEVLEFQVRRIVSTMMVPGAERGDSNHGSLVVSLEGVDYLTDAQCAGFEALPLRPYGETRTTSDIHAMRTFPTDHGFDVRFHSGHMREREFGFSPSLRTTPSATSTSFHSTTGRQTLRDSVPSINRCASVDTSKIRSCRSVAGRRSRSSTMVQ
jgi:arylamine N-acetyltransferase